jgi:MFS family permease
LNQTQQATPGRWRSIVRSLRHRNYRLFFAGQIVSLCGTFLTQVAMVWLVYSITHSGKILGITAFAGQVPAFALGPFAGVWVDRLNRHRLIVITQTLAMCQSFALAGLVYFFKSPNVVVPGLIGLALAQGLINAFDMPGRQAFLVEMVANREDLANAIALNSTMVHAARLIGPALAGLLIQYVGPVLCFLLDGVSYIAVIAALLAMRIQHKPPRTQIKSVLAELREGFSYVWGFEPIRAMLLLMAILSLTGMPAFSVLMPIFANALGGLADAKGAQTLGFLLGASAAGALAGAIYLASRRSVVGLGRVIAQAAFTFGAALMAFSFSHVLWLSLLLVPIAGCSMLITFASSNTLLQTLTEDEKRGRVMSFFTMSFVGMTPWGNLLAGTMADVLVSGDPEALWARFDGAARTLQIMGMICVIAAVSFATKLPAIRRVIRPIYEQKGIVPPQVAAGLRDATEVVSASEQQ